MWRLEEQEAWEAGQKVVGALREAARARPGDFDRAHSVAFAADVYLRNPLRDNRAWAERVHAEVRRELRCKHDVEIERLLRDTLRWSTHRLECLW